MTATNFQPAPDFGLLMSQLCAGDLSADDAGRLTSLLEQDEPSRETFVRYMNLHAELMWRAGGARQVVAEAPAAVPPEVTLEFPSEAPSGLQADVPAAAQPEALPDFPAELSAELQQAARPVASRRRIPLSVRLLALAASLLVATYFVSMVAYVLVRNDEAPPVVVATLQETRNARWQIDKSEVRRLKVEGGKHQSDISNQKSEIHSAEPLSLASGIVELQLKQGVTLVVEGPANWTIDGDNRATLKRGKLVATVPHEAIGFTVKTPTAEIVDLGTEFSVTVAPSGSTDLHVLTGEVQIQQIEYARPDTKRPSPVGAWRRVSAGQSLRAIPASAELVSIPHDATRIAGPSPEPPLPELKEIILLGNLFDDTRQTSLAEALKTDPFGAEPTADSLGVERVSYGGDARQQIAPNLWFDFSSVLWNDQQYGTISNDSVTLVPGAEVRNHPAPHAISTQGVFSSPVGDKQEDGIGMQANSLLTFDLDELRRAAGLADRQPLLFRCDRAGINDTVLGSRYHAAQMVVIVSSESRVLGAWLNGRFHTVSQEGGVWQFANPRAIAPRANGAFVELALPVTSDVRWLTLAVADGGARRAGYSVWSGARIAGISLPDQGNPYFDRSRPLAREAKASDFSAAFPVAAPVSGLLAHWEGDDLPGPDGRPSAAATFVADGIQATEITTDAGKPANVDLGPTTGRSISTAIVPYRSFAEKAGYLDENRENFGTRYYTFSVALDTAAARRGTLALSEVSAYIAHPVPGRTGQYRFDYSTDGIHFVEGDPGTFEGAGWQECRQALSLSGIRPGAKVQFRLVPSTSTHGGSVRMDDVQVFGEILSAD